MTEDKQGMEPPTEEFVTEGVMVAIPLCFPGVSQPPPAGETAINVLTVTDDRRICCGTCGDRAHVLVGRIHGETGAFRPATAIPESTAIHAIVPVDGTEQDVWVVASGQHHAALWRLNAAMPSGLIQEWTPIRSARPEKVCDLPAGARIAHAVPIDGGRRIVCLSATGAVFAIHPERAHIDAVGHVGGPVTKRSRLACDLSQHVWGLAPDGRLWSWASDAADLQRIDLTAPQSGGEQVRDVTWALDPRDSTLYGAANPGGMLFALHPLEHRIDPLGPASRLGSVNCLAIGNHGRLFGAAGEENDIGHLFGCDLPDPTVRNLGVAVSTLTVRQYGYHFRCMAVGEGGEIYLGQHERVSHLWVWFPPLRRRQREPGTDNAGN